MPPAVDLLGRSFVALAKPSAGGIARIELGGDDRAGPAADARWKSDILPAVGAAIADGLTDNPGTGLELPQQFPGAGVDGFEPAVHRAVEDHAAARRECSAPQRQVLLDFKDLPLRDGVPGREDS